MITAVEYLALLPQERWAIIEERVFGCRVVYKRGKPVIDPPTEIDPYHQLYHVNSGCLGVMPLPNRDQPNGWWEIVAEMEQKGWGYAIDNWQEQGKAYVLFSKLGPRQSFSNGLQLNIALAVQVAALRAVGFIE